MPHHLTEAEGFMLSQGGLFYVPLPSERGFIGRLHTMG